MNYYIGDTHFGHANVIRHDQRPFSNIDEMDRAIIENWNNRVTNSDSIYIYCWRFHISWGKRA